MTKADKLLCRMTIFAVIVLILAFWSIARAVDVHFHWGASTGQVDGYRIYYRHSPGDYSNQLCEVNGITFNYVASLDKTLKYYLICRAFNIYGESGDSNEVYWSYGGSVMSGITPPGCTF